MTRPRMLADSIAQFQRREQRRKFWEVVWREALTLAVLGAMAWVLVESWYRSIEAVTP